MRLRRPTLSPFALAAIALAAAAPLPAETTQCTAITSLPYTINSSGVYCLTADLVTPILSGAAITIRTQDVTLDLNGHFLQGSQLESTVANGILSDGRPRITVRNGKVIGFGTAVNLGGNTATGNIIEDLTLQGSRGIAILATACRYCIVRRNSVFNTGGGTAYSTNGVAVAILVRGNQNVIRDNDIMAVRGTGSGFGYAVDVNPSSHTVVEGNRITNAYMGVLVGGSNVLVSDNRFTSLVYGIEYLAGSTGKYRDNLTSGVITPFVGGTSAGNNN